MLKGSRSEFGRWSVRVFCLLATVAVVGLCCVAVAALGGVAPALSDGGHRVGSRRVSAPGVPVAGRVLPRDVAKGRLRGPSLAQMARRRRWLESPGARAQRVASRMEFHGLAGGAAKGLLVRDYGSVLAGVGGNPAASVARSGRVVRYIGDYEAVVRGAHGLRIERSTTPLVVGGGMGKRPVDRILRCVRRVVRLCRRRLWRVSRSRGIRPAVWLWGVAGCV